MRISALLPEHLDAARALVARTVIATYGPFCPDLKAAAERDPAGVVSLGLSLEGAWMAWQDDRAVGLVLTTGDLLRELFVAPESQGQGFGRLLLFVAEREIGLRGHAAARLDVAEPNTRARAFYAAAGWHATERRYPHPRWGFALIEMRKALPQPEWHGPGSAHTDTRWSG